MKKIIVLVLVLAASCFGARIKQDDVSRKISFVAVDKTDYITAETSLTNVAVYYSIDGGAATAMTTPTATAASAANMPGVFWLSVDEAGMVALSTGVDEAELIMYVTADEMAPVTLSAEVYRDNIGAVKAKTDNLPASPAAVGSEMALADGAITAAKIATDAIDADALKADAATEIKTALEANGTKLDTLYDDWADNGRLDLILDKSAKFGRY